MKYIKSNINLLVLVSILSLMAGCKHDHSDHDHGTDSAQSMAEGTNDKEVHLNEAQFKNAGISLGGFVMKNLSDVVNANGYTKLDPQDEAEVSMPISGTIKSINVIEGNYIKRGQALAKMTSLEYNKMLQEEVELQEKLAVSKSDKSYLKLEFERQKTLAKDNINARKVFEKVSSDLQKTEFKIKSLNDQIKILNQAIDMISPSKGSTVNITAPISGYVTHVDAKIGTIVHPEKPIFKIVDNSKMHVDLLIYEKDLSKIKVDQTVRFILTNQSNQEIKGQIYNIGKSFANETKSVAVHADIEENNANLIPGMYINALIDIGNNEVQTLPEEAIVMAEGRNFIFVKLGHHHGESEDQHSHDVEEIEFLRIEVSTGASQLGHIEVKPLAAIPEGSEIVTGGAYYLQSHLQKSEGGGGHSH